MFVQNFIKLSAAAHQLSCWQCLNAENNTAVVSGSSDDFGDFDL